MKQLLKRLQATASVKIKRLIQRSRQKKQERRMIMLTEEIICNTCDTPKNQCPRVNGTVVKYTKCP